MIECGKIPDPAAQAPVSFRPRAAEYDDLFNELRELGLERAGRSAEGCSRPPIMIEHCKRCSCGGRAGASVNDAR
jgi:hypothetical protein